MRRFLGILVGATILSMPLTVSAHHFLKHDFYIYCGESTNFMIGAHVTLSYAGGYQEGDTGKPHGNVTFRVPGEVTDAQLTVTYPGYCDLDEVIALDARPRSGGQGYWVAIYPCPAGPER
jgi:hypothetical protein